MRKSCVFLFPFYMWHLLLTLERDVRVFWRIAKRKTLICWKSSILTRSLNRVGFNFWDLSRNHKGHVLAVKCRRIFYLSSGTPWISYLSFAFLLYFATCASTSTCALLPPTHTHVYAAYSSTLPPHSSPFFSLCYYGVCLPLPLCL